MNKTNTIAESIEIINYHLSSYGLSNLSDKKLSTWGLNVNGDLLTDLIMWSLDYISEQHSIVCEN